MSQYEQSQPVPASQKAMVAESAQRPSFQPNTSGSFTWAISSAEMIGLCQRVGQSLKAGVEIRRVWQHEATRGQESHRKHMEFIFRQVSAGGAMADAMRGCGGYFPPLACQMVEIGEKTGQLDEVLLKLAHYYEQQASMRKLFYLGIAWPMLQLTAATLVIALVIWINGFINAMAGGDGIDILGIGLAGGSGALLFLASVATVIAGIALAANALMRGWFGTAPVRIAMRLPVIGGCLEAFSLSRLTWSFALGLESGMDARRVVELAVAATQNSNYQQHSAAISSAVGRGESFHEAFAQTRAFPDDFLFALETAEIAGTTNESLLRLTKQYEDKAQGAMRLLTMAATALTFVTVGFVLILAIARLAMFYIGQINQALEPL